MTPFRIGFGYDVHQLSETHEFWLGGIRVPHTKGAVGHSDADVLIHVICDALLGADPLQVGQQRRRRHQAERVVVGARPDRLGRIAAGSAALVSGDIAKCDFASDALQHLLDGQFRGIQLYGIGRRLERGHCALGVALIARTYLI